MYKFVSILLITVSFILFSCKSEVNKANATPTQLKHIEIMEIHDEVMLETNKISKLVRQLNSSKRKIPQNNTSLLKMFDSYISDLEAAEESMMVWMKEYKKPDFNDESVTTVSYLQQERKRIEDIQKKTTKSMVNGNGLLNKIQSSQNK